MTRARRLALVCLLAPAPALLLAACGGGSGGAAAPAQAGLRGVQWVLDTARLGIGGAGSVHAWLRFEQGDRVSGDDGCNAFSGTYRASGTSLSFGPLAGTRRLCGEPADSVAGAVLAALDRTHGYRADATTLVLLDAQGAPLLEYTATTPSVAGRWDVVSVLFNDAIRGVIDGTTLTAGFAADGRLSGSGGCNTFSGPYAVGGERSLRIGPLAATMMACASPAGANEQERGYLAALESVRSFEQQGDRLTLLDGQGRMAVTLTRAG